MNEQKNGNFDQLTEQNDNFFDGNASFFIKKVGLCCFGGFCFGVWQDNAFANLFMATFLWVMIGQRK